MAIATLRHCSLPWYDAAGPPVSLTATPLASLTDVGTRDRLSLVAQFAAHQAFLQFAGIADGDLVAGEWVVIRKRGHDCRLMRIGARACDPSEAPPVLAVIHEFGEAIGAELAIFKRSWARAESVYTEAHQILRRDAAADLRWMHRSASGEVLSPGSDALRDIWSGPLSRQTWSDRNVVEALTLLSSLDRSSSFLRLESDFPLHRYGALATLDASLAGSDESEAAVAETIAAYVADRRHVIAVSSNIDRASFRAIEIAASLGTATWLFHADASELPATRWFVLSHRMSGRESMDARLSTLGDPRPWIETFVASEEYGAYLDSGSVLVADAFATLSELRRSYLAALALLGVRIPAATASRFLHDFFFDGPLTELVREGISRIDGDAFCFESEAIRAHCSTHIPSASRAALCRTAALSADPSRAAFLLMEAGDTAAGLAKLEELDWKDAEGIVEKLWRFPPAALTSRLARLLCHALVDCGRYRDATAAAQTLDGDERELVLARCDRRSGDYDTALVRLDRIAKPGIDALFLRCELLRVGGRFEDAIEILNLADPRADEDRVRVAYERSLLALETGTAADDEWANRDHYFSARYLTYRALADGDFDAAEQLAAESLRLARTPIDRVDAWLDLVFASFSAGRWTDTRRMALEALSAIEETQGDRAAAGILFTLTYLAADDGQWRSAAAMLDRLRHYYSGVNDSARLFELTLLDAHLHFSAGRFGQATRLALQVLDRPRLLPQIREAAALIVDEVNGIEHVAEPLRSTGGSGNRELTERHAALLNPRKTLQPAITRSDRLKRMRAALASGSIDVAHGLARELGVDLDTANASSTAELEALHAAATAEWPYAPDIFARRWVFAIRNRLGHWRTFGSDETAPADLDRIAAEGSKGWIACSERELLFMERCEEWPPSMQQALAAIVRTRAENDRLRRLIDQNEQPVAKTMAPAGMIGESAAIRSVFDAIARIARRDVAVCVRGESGTGKELVAKAIHRDSSRRAKPFVAINCAALPENLIESELFGHVRGAFTGADRDRAGLIETSDGGTLFLDEIGELPLVAQAKLLRFLQDGEFRRVGDAANRTSDVRVISATNRPLESAVEEGRFREDLYYRIRGVEISIPPLRDRGDDVLLLARYFLGEERTKHRGGPAAFSSETEVLLRTYRWPGNVRELQNAIRAGHAMAGDASEITIEHLPDRLRTATPSRVMAGSYQDAVARFRRDLIEKSLLEAGGNQNRAAALLNLSRQALAYQIRELGILVRKRPAPPV